MQLQNDGASGIFAIDTGDNGSVTILGSFYDKNRFSVEQPPQVRSLGGVGGLGSALLTRVGRIDVGEWRLDNQLVTLSFAGRGVFSSE